ncbi:retrotransposon protein, putative, ty1-copia subclass [Tanacetum coccineum]
MPKRVNPRQANMVNDNMDMIAMVSDVNAMISEVNLVGSNNSGWWVDTEATRHVCADKSMFHSFRAVDNEEKLYMGNSATADIKGEGDVILKMTSEKELKLTNVFKDKAIDKFGLYKTKVENQLGRKIKVVRSDRGGEYVSLFAKLCAKHGIRHEFTAPYSPQQNSIAKRKNRTLKEMVNAMLINSGLSEDIQDQLEEEKVEPRRSKRARTEKSFGHDFVSFMVENEPTSYQEALMDLPPGCKPLGYKWIFKKKMKADGTIDKYKARLVIKGYRQREGLDYFDTYSPVTRITSIRIVLAIAALRNLEVHQMDVKMAFLNRVLEEEIYMNQPEGFIAPGQVSKVCRLVKSLYGLKQAPKQCHQKFDHTMLESGFKINECDSNDKMIKSTKDMLKSKFGMKDMGLTDVILGIKIIRTHNGLVLSQTWKEYTIHKFRSNLLGLGCRHNYLG